MKSKDKLETPQKSPDENQNFPLRGPYFVVIITLVILSLVKLSIQTGQTSTFPLQSSAEVQVNSITLILLLLIWLPFLIPWMIKMSPSLQDFLTGLRKSGLAEFGAGIVNIKLTPEMEQAADFYKREVLVSSASTVSNLRENEKLETAYKESIESVRRASKGLTSSDAMKKLDELALNYDKIRKDLPSGNERSQLMRSIASAMWALIPSIQGFPVRAKLNSEEGGERLSAYKFLEWYPSIEYTDLLLARAIGVLEVPFGQYGALLALRRLVIDLKIAPDTQSRILRILEWNSELEFLGEDRRYLMKTIMSILEEKAKSI